MPNNPPSTPKVKTTVRDWGTECAMADAADAADTGQQGVVALIGKMQYPEAYVFSNGRKFAHPRKFSYEEP